MSLYFWGVLPYFSETVLFTRCSSETCKDIQSTFHLDVKAQKKE